MEDIENIIMRFESTKKMVEQLEKAFNELKPNGESSPRWEEIKDYFQKLEASVERKLMEVKEAKRVVEETCKMIEVREEAVVAKEEALLDRLQELKDGFVSAIMEARKKDKDVSDSKSDDEAEAQDVEVKSLLPQLKELCEQMDAKGLLKFLSANKKNLATISKELSIALKSAKEPHRLVIDSLEDFYPLDSSDSQGSEDTGLQLLRRTCFVLMEAAAPLLGMADAGDGYPMSSEIKQQAKEIAEQWKAKVAVVDIDACNGYSLEILAFLQFLATFGIAEEFDIDEHYKLVIGISRHREAPELCRALGLTDKMPGFVETLVNSGRPIDAVHFGHAFQLTESFPPVPLLKEHLEQNIGRKAAVSWQNDFNKKELGALRVVIKCIEEYKLQELYPVDPLKIRLAQLEKAKYHKKRLRRAINSQVKKPRGNETRAFRKPSSAVDNWQPPRSSYHERGLNPGLAERYPERCTSTVPHAYEVAGHAPYSRQPNAQRSYYYQDERVAPASYSTSSNYGSYGGAGLQSSTPNNYENYTGAGVQAASSYYGGCTGAQPSHQSGL
ncbi:FRIGIDA-like protein 3 [Iris pallida]|uniref:FRIGIDA-like protein n=1 Tax=Iris pallida TaxID=29817 RepID=A0AAX6H0C3_IRIPA|nr:FRIGIDA-like protein 3 [Iris pallida]